MASRDFSRGGNPPQAGPQRRTDFSGHSSSTFMLVLTWRSCVLTAMAENHQSRASRRKLRMLSAELALPLRVMPRQGLEPEADQRHNPGIKSEGRVTYADCAASSLLRIPDGNT